MSIKGICFDIDGTLYPSWMTKVLLIPSIFPSATLMNSVRQFRNLVREEGYEHRGGTGEEAFLAEQASYVLEKMDLPVTDDFIDTMKARIENQLYKRMEKAFTHIKPLPYLAETMKKLKDDGLLLAALSDFPVTKKLETLGVADYVSLTACAQETGYLKPHRAPFDMMAELMGLPHDQILYVGDSYRKDMVGASRAGMKTILLMRSLRDTTEREKYTAAHPDAGLIFSDYRDFYQQVTCLTT